MKKDVSIWLRNEVEAPTQRVGRTPAPLLRYYSSLGRARQKARLVMLKLAGS
jgi:hypothetical protein